jgi:hypothetical protein
MSPEIEKALSCYVDPPRVALQEAQLTEIRQAAFEIRREERQRYWLEITARAEDRSSAFLAALLRERSR